MPTQKEIDSFKKVKPENRTEEQWNAIYDANTLANAAIIQNDSERLQMAIIAANVLLQEEKDQANAMSEVANMQTS